MLENYNPLGVELFESQRETINFILKYKRCFVLDDMGTGKTMAALAVCDILMKYGKISKVLIVAPISVLQATWCKHILEHFPGRTFTMLHGNGGKPRRLANLALKKDFYIINTDGIKTIEAEIIRKNFDMVIIDESTSYSRHTSARTKCAWRICHLAKSVVAMTGNPIPNDTIQSYAQAKLLDINRPRYFTKFRDQLKIKFDMYTYLDKPGAVDLAYAILTPSIRHKLEDCVDLPPITYDYRDISLTAEQEKHYKLMEKEYITWLDSGEAITAANAAVKGSKLLQISSGIIIKDGVGMKINHKHRLDELTRLRSQTNKIIIFASFTESVNQLVADIPGAEKIDGSVKGPKRFDIITRFQEGNLDTLVCQPAAISHGVTLTASDTIVWWGPPYSNEHFIQCNRRIRRPSQTRPQRVFMFRSTRVEKRVYSNLERKQKVSAAFLSLVE